MPNPAPSHPPLVAQVQRETQGLRVDFQSGAPAKLFSWMWLRDHGEDPASLDAHTRQRKVDTFALPWDLCAREVRWDPEQQRLHLDWPDRAQSYISGLSLVQAAGHSPGSQATTPHLPTRLWDAEQPLEHWPTVDYEALIHSEQGRQQWLAQIATHGFCVLAQVPPTREATCAIAERTGPVRETIFGRMWELSAELKEHGDSAYSSQYLEPHTDATYYHDAPGLQMFNCLVFDGRGGESILLDGFAAAERLKRDHPDAYALLSQIDIPCHYLEPGVHLYAERPALRHDRRGVLQQISFNNYDRAPFYLESEAQMQGFYAAYRQLHQQIIDQQHWIKIPLRPGMALVFDNWRTLHGRMGYVGKRVFYGCYHSRSEFDSALRQLTP